MSPHTFVVPGDPKGQGSLALWRAPDGSERAKHPAATTAHRNLVVGVLTKAWAGREPIRGPVAVRCEFRFTRPKHHYGTGRNAHSVKTSAPEWQVSYPDGDKALRLCLDALVIAGVLADDSQVCLSRFEKRYDSTGSTSLEVYEL